MKEKEEPTKVEAEKKPIEEEKILDEGLTLELLKSFSNEDTCN